MVIAYSKVENVSTIEEITRHAKSKGFGIDIIITENLKDSLSPKDILFVENVYELEENPQSILNLIKHCVVNQIPIYCVEGDYCFDSNKIKELNVFLTLFVELCEYRSNKAKESLRLLKESGVKLGRTEGTTVKLNKMKRRKESIIKDLEKGLSLNHIYEKYQVSRTTINKLRTIEPRIEEILKNRERNNKL